MRLEDPIKILNEDCVTIGDNTVSFDDFRKKVLSLFPFDKYRKEIKSYEVKLEKDPLKDLASHDEKFQILQSYRDRVVSVLNEALEFHNRVSSLFKMMKSDYDIKFNGALVTDEEIKKLSSKELRISAANDKYNEEMKKMRVVDLCILEIKTFIEEITNVCNNLDTTRESLKHQQFNGKMRMLINGVVTDGKIRLSGEDWNK